MTTTPVRARVRLPADVALVAGLVATVVGTFLPWLQSGSVTRNSYTTDGALQRLLDLDGAIGTLLDVWPFLSIACAAAVALVLLRHVWAGAVVALIATGCAGGAAFAALSTDIHFIVRPATVGPAVTATGAVVVWLAVLARVLLLDRFSRRFR